MELLLTLVAIIGGTYLIIKLLDNNNNNKRSEGKIADSDVKFDDVQNYVKSFVPVYDQKLQYGYTEKSIENQLAKYLKQRYLTVTQQHGVADKNARQIDIDIANGVVGIELKDATKILKTAEFDRLNGQLLAYLENRYTKDNLILLVCGDASILDDSRYQDVIKLCNKLRVKLVYSVINFQN
jgi:hypothetical protein